MNTKSKSSIVYEAPLLKLTTPGGLEWTYLISASDEADLEVIRRENQVHYNSYSAKCEWTKFVCTRNPTAHGNCKYGLLAMDMQNKSEGANMHRFHIYSRGIHNHQVIPIKPTPKQVELKTIRSSNMASTNSKSNNMKDQKGQCNHPRQINMQEIRPSSSRAPSKPVDNRLVNPIEGKALTVFNICHSFNDLERLRRAEGLLVDKQFNVVDGVPEKVSYRCRTDAKCPFQLHALHNRDAGFFELYAPEVNLHVHNESKEQQLTEQHGFHPKQARIKTEDLPSNSGTTHNQNGLPPTHCDAAGLSIMTVKETDWTAINKQLNRLQAAPKVKILQNIQRSRSKHPINIKMHEWKFMCELQNESQFERIRKDLRVVSLHQQGKLFTTVRQQTLKCYRRISKKGKCPYRILLFRDGDDRQPLKMYEKGVHNHYVPQIHLPQPSRPLSHHPETNASLRQAQPCTSSTGKHDGRGGDFIIPLINEHIPPPPHSLQKYQKRPFSVEFSLPTSSSSNENLLRKVEETIGKMNSSELESIKEERSSVNCHQEGEGQSTVVSNFSIMDCNSELNELADEFELEFSSDSTLVILKQLDDDGACIVISERDSLVNIDEYRNGIFNGGKTQQWIKGDQVQFIYAMRARIQEFIKGPPEERPPNFGLF